MSRRIDDIIQFFDEVESLMASVWEFQFASPRGSWSPATDVFVTDDEVNVLMDLPGVEQQNMSIAISPVLLEVSGYRPSPAAFRHGTSFHELEIPYGVFRKRIVLPVRVDPRRMKAVLKDGLLTLRLPFALRRR